MSERNAAAVTALARAAALSLYACQEGQINLHKLLDAAVDSTIDPPLMPPAPPAGGLLCLPRGLPLPGLCGETAFRVSRSIFLSSGWQLHLQTAR
ncbi:MAG: hypothetical protein U0X20_17705 [Caldilineaceae bacterium]